MVKKMFKFIKSRNSESALIDLAKSAEIMPIFRDGKYSSFIVKLTDDRALRQKSLDSRSIGSFIGVIDNRIQDDDFDSPLPKQDGAYRPHADDDCGKSNARRHVIFFPADENSSPKLLFEWPEAEKAEAKILEEFRISFFSIKLEQNLGAYKLKLTAIDSRTNQFAFSYGLEKSPFAECFVCVNADGSRFDMGESFGDVQPESFRNAAIDFAIKKIYDDQLVSPEIVNSLAVSALSSKLNDAGMQVLAANKDDQDGPQIFCMREGRTIAVIVRANIYPNRGDLGDRTDKEVNDLITSYRLREQDLYFASVTLFNADARNEYEKRALLRNSSFRMDVAEFGPIDECQIYFSKQKI